MEILIITGMSGAGKTSVLNLCQDNEYYCIDNMPPSLIKDFIFLVERSDFQFNKFACVVDIRSAGFNLNIKKEIDALEDMGHKVEIIFIDSDDDVLIKRYKENRRPHPIKGVTIEDAIREERTYLKGLKKISRYYVNTSKYNLPRLKNRLESLVFASGEFKIQVVSFGFKSGILSEADLVFDVRFTPNPFYIDSLKAKNGRDKEVKDYVFSDPIVVEFIRKITDLVFFLADKYKKEGKSNLVIGIGCTGGQHRSPAIAEELKLKLSEKFSVGIFHRESKMW